MNKGRNCQIQGHVYFKTGPDDKQRKCMTCGKEQVREQGGPWVDAPKQPRPRVVKDLKGLQSLWDQQNQN